MRQTLAAALLSLFALSPALAARSPVETVGGFYTLRLQNGSDGIPTGLELAAFSSYLAPELVCMLGAAMRYSDQYAKALPDKSPPFAKGDLYSSSPMIPASFTTGTASTASATSEIHVRFSRDATDTAEAQTWSDTVHVSLRRRHWLISDIVYGGAFPDAAQGSLMARLRETLSHPDEASHWDAHELSACTLEPAASHSSGRHGAKQKGQRGSKGKAAKGSARHATGKAAPRKHKR